VIVIQVTIHPDTVATAVAHVHHPQFILTYALFQGKGLKAQFATQKKSGVNVGHIQRCLPSVVTQTQLLFAETVFELQESHCILPCFQFNLSWAFFA
jgi:hypothetical protein